MKQSEGVVGTGQETDASRAGEVTVTLLRKRRLYDPLEAGPAHFAHNDALWKWVKDNIQLPRSLISEIESELQKIKAKSSASVS